MALYILHPYLGSASSSQIANSFANLSVTDELGGPGRFAWKCDNEDNFSVAGITVGAFAHTGTASTRFRTNGPYASFTGNGRRIIHVRAHNGSSRTLLYHAMITNSGLLRLVEGSTSLALGTEVMDLLEDYVVQLQVIPGASADVTARLYDATGTALLDEIGATRNTIQNAGNAEFAIGHTPPGSPGEEITSWWWDTVYLDDGNWPDPTRQFFLVFPTGDGTDTDSGQGDATTIDDLAASLVSDGDQVVEVFSGARRSFAIDNPLNAGAEVELVAASALLGAGGGSGSEGLLYFGDGTNRDEGPSAAPGSGSVYNGLLRTTAPDGNPWDWDAIDELELGFRETASPGGGQFLEVELAVVLIWATDGSAAQSLSGSAAGTSTGVAALLAQRTLAGLGEGTSVATAAILAQRALVAAGAGSSTATAALSAQRNLTGAAEGSSTGAVALAAQRNLSATGAGAAAASAVLRAQRNLAATAAGSSTGTAVMLTLDGLAGEAEGTSTASAVMNAQRNLTGSVGGQATAAAALAVGRLLSGTGAGSSTGSAALQAQRQLSSLAGGTSSAAAVLVATRQLSGLGSGTATGVAALAATHLLTGSAAGSALASAALTRQSPFVYSGISDFGVDLSTNKPITGVETFRPSIRRLT